MMISPHRVGTKFCSISVCLSILCWLLNQEFIVYLFMNLRMLYLNAFSLHFCVNLYTVFLIKLVLNCRAGLQGCQIQINLHILVWEDLQEATHLLA